jgi:hypothetical protein
MSRPASEPVRPPAASRPLSVRVQLARLALESALAVDGVVGSDPGPRGMWATADERERLPGVTSMARADGTYGLALHLVTRVVPLHPLADRVRARVARAAARAGLAERLGPLDITIEDVVEAGGIG